jgi:hypothetical protein
MAIPAVFAVFAGNNQPPGSRSPRKSWAGAGVANERTARCPAVLPLFPAVLVAQSSREEALPRKMVERASDEIHLDATITQYSSVVNLINNASALSL